MSEDAIGLVVFVCGLLLLLLFSPSSWRRTVVFFLFLGLLLVRK